MAMLELVQNSWISSNVQPPRLASLLACAAGTTAGVDDVSAVSPRERRNTSQEHTPLSSGCWVRESEVLLSNCKWGFPVSRIVLTPDYIALMEENTWRPSPGTNVAEMRTGTRLPAWSMMYPQMVAVAVANTFLFPLVMIVFGSFSFL